MNKNSFLIACLLSFSLAHAQYCVNAGPTSSVDSNVQSVQLTGQTGAINFTTICPGTLGVQDLTAQSATLNATNSYTLNVQFGTCNGNYTGAGEAWIDFDQSGSFEPNESVGTWQGIPPTPLSVFNFTVPANAHNGLTRMRVMQHEGGNIVPPLDPCATYAWGSMMDFGITITGGLNCTGYTGDDTNDPIIVAGFPYSDTRDNSICYTNKSYAYPSPDVFYLIFPSSQSAAIHASLCGSAFDTFLSIIDTHGNVLAYNDDAASCGQQSEVTCSTVGIDSAYVIVEGWGSASGNYVLNITEDILGVGEYDFSSVEIFPNPAKEYLKITGDVFGKVSITDISGKTVSEIENYSGENISTSDLAAGVYFVLFTVNEKQITRKIIISE